MTSIRNLALAAVATALCLAGPAARAAADHSSHHPAASASAPGDAQGAAEEASRMDEHMKHMREMHEKMMNAKTPEERSALRAEHMKAMQDGMAMMGGAGAGGGMQCHGAKQGKGAMHDNMAAHHEAIEKRLDMMQSMMQMMLDRLPATPAKQ